MPQRIFLLTQGKPPQPLVETDYLNEDELQRLIAASPEVIDGDLVDPESPRRWLLIRREMPVTNDESGGRWSLDHLLLDQDGVPTLVEVKRSSDTRSRREVVAQMLDYAANAVQFWPVDSVRGMFEERCQRDGLDSEKTLADFLGVGGEPERFWPQVKTNLLAGKVRLLFLADTISPELRRIIEFLNRQMDPAEVLGLELRQFSDGAARTLVPHVIGQTSEAEQRKGLASGSAASRQWDEQSVMARMRELNGDDVTDVASRLLSWAKARATRVWYGRGKTNGSFVPVLEHDGDSHQAFAVYTGSKPNSAGCEIYFYWYAYKSPFDQEALRLVMLGKLNGIDGVALPQDAIYRRPSIPLRVLAVGNRVEQFLRVMDWYLEQIIQS